MQCHQKSCHICFNLISFTCSSSGMISLAGTMQKMWEWFSVSDKENDGACLGCMSNTVYKAKSACYNIKLHAPRTKGQQATLGLCSSWTRLRAVQLMQ